MFYGTDSSYVLAHGPATQNCLSNFYVLFRLILFLAVTLQKSSMTDQQYFMGL